jgi:hypothetical protein
MLKKSRGEFATNLTDEPMGPRKAAPKSSRVDGAGELSILVIICKKNCEKKKETDRKQLSKE